jgi:hypothetical protein
LALGFGLSSLVTGDFNGDGELDLAVTGTAFFSYNEVEAALVLLGDGRGNFNPADMYRDDLPGIQDYGAAAGDFNGDGILDLAITDGNRSRLLVLLNDGTGNLTLASTPQVGNGPTAVVSGDFNGDGILDLAASNTGLNNLTILLGDGTGNFTTTASPETFANPTGIAPGDFNGSGRLDFAVASGEGVVSILFDPAVPPSALDVSSSFSIASTGLIYSRVTQSYHGTITVTNTGTQAFAGPLELTFQNLPSGVSLNAPSGTFQGAPWLNLPGGLAPGQSVSLTLQFSDPANTPVTFTNKLYSGTL